MGEIMKEPNLDDSSGQLALGKVAGTTAVWTVTDCPDDATTTTTTECDECDAAGMVSPLLKASQESAGRTVPNLCCLTQSSEATEGDDDVMSGGGGDKTMDLLRQMRRRNASHDDDDAGSLNSSTSNKKPRLTDSPAVRSSESDPFYTYPVPSALSPAKGGGGLGEQIVDAASILLSIGQQAVLGFRTGPHHPDSGRRWTPVKQEDLMDESEEEEGEASGDDYISSKTTSPSCQGHDDDSPNGQHHHHHHYTDEIRVFPGTLPIELDEFPLLYQRYRVPSSIAPAKRMAVFGAEKAADIRDEELRAVAIRGMRELGAWNEPHDVLDLYTPRWVRGSLKDKMGLCTICYEEDSSHLVWKRTKTSEYNYHLINQHGISPHTRRPYDPPIAFRTREQTSTSAGHRKTVIQGKCHACKKYIDMQGKYTGKVKVPEIYWWKHARKCHKGRKGLTGSEGVFVEDKVSAI